MTACLSAALLAADADNLNQNIFISLRHATAGRRDVVHSVKSRCKQVPGAGMADGTARVRHAAMRDAIR
jgi:hypothetical protein